VLKTKTIIVIMISRYTAQAFTECQSFVQHRQRPLCAVHAVHKTRSEGPMAERSDIIQERGNKQCPQTGPQCSLQPRYSFRYCYWHIFL